MRSPPWRCGRRDTDGRGHGHGHSGTGGHAGGRHRWRLLVAFVLVGTFFVVELVAGLVAGSLALLSDAGHMAADVVALGAAPGGDEGGDAARPVRPAHLLAPTGREVFASGFTVLLMLGVAVYVVVEAIGRIGESVEVDFGPMLVVGGLGLLVNVVCLVLLRAGARESINVKGAYPRSSPTRRAASG